jgi:MSHA pilin protein MshC
MTLSKPFSPSKERGFTLIELIVVMVVVGIMAVVAVPKFAERSDFDNRGFQDETRALLRYAQKSAVAQRRNVCVALNAAGVTLTIDTDTPADGVCNSALATPSPPRPGNGLVPSVATFTFRPLGDTDKAADVTATIAGTPITVDFKTGYVY